MSEITKELKEIKKGQNKIVRKLEFIINGAIAVIGMYNAQTSDDKVELIMGIIVASLATICQGLLVYEDIKEIIAEPDEEEEED